MGLAINTLTGSAATLSFVLALSLSLFLLLPLFPFFADLLEFYVITLVSGANHDA